MAPIVMRHARVRAPQPLDAFDDTQVAVDRVAEHFERSLITGTVVRGGGLRDAVELDQHDAFLAAFLVSLGGSATGEKAAAGGGDRRSGELGIGGKRVRVGNRKVGRNPISFGHRVLPNCVVAIALLYKRRRDYQAGPTEGEGVWASLLVMPGLDPGIHAEQRPLGNRGLDLGMD